MLFLILFAPKNLKEKVQRNLLVTIIYVCNYENVSDCDNKFLLVGTLCKMQYSKLWGHYYALYISVIFILRNT